jgi:CDP-paratose 2-epimerase
MRGYFFGEKSSTHEVSENLKKTYENFIFYNVDIRNYNGLEKIFKEYSSDIDIIIHTAAQPSHDWAVKEPITDFTVNANGTLNLLELTRLYCPKSTFIFTSTNKVYGDNPNKLKLVELDKRFEYFENGILSNGIDERMNIDNTLHSLFGVSKTSADLLCQEYGKYFGINVGVFRGGCLTGSNHKSTELHGFLSYLVNCVKNNSTYTIFGYKGKQVRDNIHSWDLVNAFWYFHQNPKQGEVYNIGGGRINSVSILESIEIIENQLDKKWNNFNIIGNNRIGDHMWYITDLTKFKTDYPGWSIKNNIDSIIKDIIIN